jgi:hypothetical protein
MLEAGGWNWKKIKFEFHFTSDSLIKIMRKKVPKKDYEKYCLRENLFGQRNKLYMSRRNLK